MKRNYRNSSYFAVSTIGSLIRFFLLANAFEYYFGTDGMNLLLAFIANETIGEFLISRTSFMSVGIVYNSGEAPAWGSALYTGTYIINNFIMIGICWLGKLTNMKLWIIIALYLIVWISLAVVASKLKNKKHDF